ncbi:Uncharacterised protein [Chlamydia trachomatis]|nr:Uncharacterised protein [Chlamydia trachomatis]
MSIVSNESNFLFEVFSYWILNSSNLVKFSPKDNSCFVKSKLKFENRLPSF